MDIFIEQLVVRKSDSKDSLLKLCIFMGMAVLCAFFITVAFFFAGMFQYVVTLAFAAIGGVIWLGVYLIKGMNREYEYILTNHELDIDKITGKRKRKRMMSVNLNGAQVLELYKEELDLQADVTVCAHDNTFVNMWYLFIKSDSHGKIVVLFSPNDSFLFKLNKALPVRSRNKIITEKNQEKI
jgi:hypothetical protein